MTVTEARPADLTPAVTTPAALNAGSSEADGVKGTIQNLTGRPILVSNSDADRFYVLHPGEVVAYAHGGQDSLRMHHAGGATTGYAIRDTGRGFPSTVFSPDCADPRILSYRADWEQHESHWERGVNVTLHVERAPNGRLSAAEPEHLAEWPVFLIRIFELG